MVLSAQHTSLYLTCAPLEESRRQPAHISFCLHHTGVFLSLLFFNDH